MQAELTSQELHSAGCKPQQRISASRKAAWDRAWVALGEKGVTIPGSKVL